MAGKFELRTFGHLQRQADNYLTSIVGKNSESKEVGNGWLGSLETRIVDVQYGAGRDTQTLCVAEESEGIN